MKNILLLSCLLVTGYCITFAQTINYRYDQVGNRIYKGVDIVISSRNVRLESRNTSQQPAIDSVVTADLRVLLYPNPFREELTLELLNRPEKADISYQVVDVAGRKVLEGIIKNGSSQQKLNFGSSPLGLYVLQLSVGSKLYEWKVVRE
jgi:hypothetical protein